MKSIALLLSLSAALLFLASCAALHAPQEKEIEKDSPDIIKQSLFDAWNDPSITNSAVADLVKQADQMIRYKQWEEAQGKLERALRVSSRYAPAWSRLSWLSLRAAQHKKSIQLAHRSNSYTNARDLKILNWLFIRDAYRLTGNSEQEKAAIDTIRRLRENAS